MLKIALICLSAVVLSIIIGLIIIGVTLAKALGSEEEMESL